MHCILAVFKSEIPQKRVGQPFNTVMDSRTITSGTCDIDITNTFGRSKEVDSAFTADSLQWLTMSLAKNSPTLKVSLGSLALERQ